jgi:glycosyltransferase involved in cell wall biosynthesis
MNVLFVHQNFPAQFGPFAFRLAAAPGWACTFVSQKQEGVVRGVRCLKYQLRGGATEQTHYCGRTFENAVWHAHAVHDRLAAAPDVRPDLIVGHSGFGSTLFLRELYPGVPIVNLFEYFYRTKDSDLDFRPDFPSKPLDKLRARARNAMILCDLDNCDRGYCPTDWQRSRFPAEYQPKLTTVFDGVDTTVWRPQPGLPRRVGGKDVPAGVKVVTYATRGMESMRGFDIFMRAAQRVADRRSDVLFVVVGQDRVCYGGDEKHTGGKSFKEWVVSQGRFDLSRFVFTGLLPEAELAKLFCITDLHVYLTVPFVLSWSLFNALACGAPVLCSDTAPVRELVADGVTGLLRPFFDVDGFADAIGRACDDPAAVRSFGEAGATLVRETYSLEQCLPRFVGLLESAAGSRSPTH